VNSGECLNLNNFVPALEQLCALSEDGNADPQQILAEASSLCTGVAAAALFPAPADPSCEWEGYLDADTLTLYSSTHQLVFTLMFNAMNSATISGPGPATWKIGLSEKGTHVSSVGADGTVYQDVLIDKAGAVTDPRDLEQSFAELKQEWDRIADTPDDALPEYTPDDLIEDFNIPDVPDIDDLPDLGSGPGGNPASGSGSGSNDDFGGSGGESSSGDASGGAFGDALGSALKGAAAVGAAAVAGMAAKAVGRAVDKAISGSGQNEKPAKPSAPQPKPGKPVSQESAKPESKTSQPENRNVDSENAQSTGKFTAIPELLLGSESGQESIVVFPCRIGRSKESDLSLDSSLVSRNHARFDLRDGLVELEDLGSSNGTFVNDEKIAAPVIMKKGMKLRFANLTFEVLSCPEPEPEPVDPDSMKTVAFNMAEKLAQAESKASAEKNAASARPSAQEKPVPSAPKVAPAPPAPRSAAARPVPKAPPAPKPASSRPAPPATRSAPPAPKAPPVSSRSGSTAGEAKLRCKKCQAELDADAKFCPDCGAPTRPEKIRCNCGAFCESGDKFCPDCGKPVGVAQGSASKSRSPAPPPSAAKRPAPPAAASAQGSSSPPPPAPSRGKAPAPARSSQAEKERRRKEREAQEDSEFVKRVSSDEALEKTALPSVRWVSFLFLIVMGLDHARIVDMKGESVIDDVVFQRGLGAGLATVFFAFIAGGSPGKRRLFTMVSAAVYFGNQVMRDLDLLSAIAQNPAMIEKNTELILPLLGLLFAAWLVKRASRQS
jgi:pSer/pThr/pTyr-binding forkhead associated (FHA) protein